MTRKRPEPLHLTPVTVTDDLAGFHAESGCGKQAFSAASRIPGFSPTRTNRSRCAMNIEELKRLALAANAMPPNENEWTDSEFRRFVLAFEQITTPSLVLELIRQRDELLAALKDAREMVSDWAGYASPYFQEKHDIDGDLKKLDDAIARMEG